MDSQPKDALAILLERHLPASGRKVAAHKLGHSDIPEVTAGLLQVARDLNEREDVSAAAGESLALIYLRQGKLLEAPLHELSGPAYLAFDETVARNQRTGK